MAIKSHINICCVVIVSLNLEQRRFLWNFRAGLQPQERTAIWKRCFSALAKSGKGEQNVRCGQKWDYILFVPEGCLGPGDTSWTNWNQCRANGGAWTGNLSNSPFIPWKREASILESMVLIRLRFGALVRHENAQGIKHYFHIKLKGGLSLNIFFYQQSTLWGFAERVLHLELAICS